MQIIGHRGAKALAPENTLAAITIALRRNVDWIEIDVRRTKDSKLVIAHDKTLFRIAKSYHHIGHYTLAELQAIATRSGEPIPTLEEVLDLVDGRAGLFIELKEAGCAAIVADLLRQQLKKGRTYTDFIIASLRPAILREAQTANDQLQLALIQHLWPFAFLGLTDVKLTAVGFHKTLAPKLAIRLAKKRGLWTFAWTVNSKRVVDWLEKRGIDAIATDRP